ncbi:GNAT family N-acetyltransferase [Microlunatus parietis]|uniref:Ribosomal protein S18 acetylase RimI-like enzyme n=1 Tax=Microlunatus parietis TaxID=682979 RepID=A0A7Y9I461_9ACTN|nr:GNAT family N-acetyltransferase [Microlunatus parietis]NYE69559.1 ribosomal protein S18 acetylase RimI-like enzyme [Microlunatus parietis]
MLELRVLTPDDWTLWRDLRLASLRDAPYAFGSKLADWADAPEQRWRERLDRPNWHHVAALHDDRPVGVLTGLPAEEVDVAELLSFWVSPEARGQGVVAALVGAVETWASDRRAGVLRLTVRSDNARAIAFYRRYGFVDTGRPGHALLGGGAELIFEKPAQSVGIG